MSEHPLLSAALRLEHDVVLARQHARQIAELLGFEAQDATRIATAVSEIARNAFRYASGGRVDYLLTDDGREQTLAVRVSDTGPGIPELAKVLDGRYRSPTGMGMGIIGARRLMDGFRIEAEAGKGTTAWLSKRLPRSPTDLADLTAHVARELASRRSDGPLDELEQQNRELVRTLEMLTTREQELLQLNRELEDTNRGVVALYAELDERLDQLRRSNALRAQFTSYLSHEFRTPLDSMLALSALLLNRVDGDLSEEQEKQVHYIRRSARDLLDMVDDLLDTARVEAGQVKIRPGRFSVGELFNALRATLRPLITSDSVLLAFDDPADLPEMHTDEAKVSQILRNLVSNALKFTERGEIRVAAEPAPGGEEIIFRVTDTGIGIPQDDQQRIFEDFEQVDGAVQRRVRGTGLGLPLSRKLARFLGGDISVASEPGSGSAFTLIIPRVYRAAEVEAGQEAVTQ
ncbi:MAG: ATP-binding protein [Gemmatimonadetes bacterium]|nr:ATP-binding protein [Gemmatimonadota bacterium]